MDARQEGSPLPIVQYWHEDELPDGIAAATATFADRTPGLDHRVFSEASAEDFIAEHLTVRELAAFRSCAVPAMQSDYFRYCAVFAAGGIYVDAGWECLADLQALLPDAGGGSLFRAPKGNVINGFFAFRSPGHRLLELALEIATVNIEGRIWSHIYFTTGSPIFIYLINLPRFGSFDAMLKRFAGTRWEALVRSCSRILGDYTYAAKACETVEIFLPGRHLEFIRRKRRPKATTGQSHWSHLEGSIFR